MRRLLNLIGRYLARRERKRAAVDPPLANWLDVEGGFDLPPAVGPGIGKPPPFGLRCPCGAPAAADEVDVCHRCRERREREAAHEAAIDEHRLRKRREAARRRARARRGVLEMPQRASR